MTAVTTIIAELNLNNGSNHKLAVLKKYKDHAELQRVLKMAYDKAAFTYGLSVKQLNTPSGDVNSAMKLEDTLYIIERDVASRQVTGHAARDLMNDLIARAKPADADLIYKIINRDLRINLGRSNINKVWPQLITKPAYMRCGIYTSKTAKDIKFPAILQLKADGTYREFSVLNGVVECVSRSGEEYTYPAIFGAFANAPDGRYFGELVVIGADGKALPRSEGNGLINSDDVPHNDLRLYVWDYVTHEEYTAAMFRGKPTTKYQARLDNLIQILLDLKTTQVELIETVWVTSIREALLKTQEWMTAGLEGSILKDASGVFKDGTSKHQLKLKLEIAIDVRVTGFKEGKAGTKREKTFGALEFATDDGQIRGYCSGFSDKQLEDFNARRSEITGLVITVVCNDITKGRDNDYYALSHPRFDEIRTDKNETDTLERALLAKESAMEIAG